MKKSIEQMIEEFSPGKYADERKKKLVDLLATKAKEKTLVEAPAIEEEEGEGPADLVAALEESMRKVKAR
jgi:DNA end-binding protein Ku